MKYKPKEIKFVSINFNVYDIYMGESLIGLATKRSHVGDGNYWCSAFKKYFGGATIEECQTAIEEWRDKQILKFCEVME